MGTVDPGRVTPVYAECALERLGIGCFWRRVDAFDFGPAGPPPAKPVRLDWIYREACRVIQQHLGDDALSVAFVATKVRCSRPTLYRAFAAHQQSVAAVIRVMRLQHACGLLASPPFTVPIETLAYRSGFDDVRTFNRSFRREFGMTPGEFRDRMVRNRLETRPG